MVCGSLRVLQASPNTKTSRHHDIAEILLKVALKHQKSNQSNRVLADNRSSIAYYSLFQHLILIRLDISLLLKLYHYIFVYFVYCRNMPHSKRQRTITTPAIKKSRNYRRYPKPPYSYVGMIIVAIETSPEKNVTLKELTTSLQNMFSFFNGSYKGWRDSIRHTLSSSPCFTRIDTIKRKSASVWATDLTKAHSNVFKRQDTDISKDGIWAVTLTKQLNIPDIPLPLKECPFAKTSPRQTPTTTMKVCSISPDFNFSIDNILSDINEHAVEQDDDSRRSINFDYDSPVFTQKNISISRHNKSTKKSYSQTELLINDQAASWGISQEQAIENLSLLCNSISQPSQTSQQDFTSSPLSTTISTMSPDGNQQRSSPQQGTTPPSVPSSSASTYSPVTPTPYSPTNQITPYDQWSSTYQHHYSLQPCTGQLVPVYSDYQSAHASSQNFYASQFQHVYSHPQYYQHYLDNYYQQQSYPFDTSSHSISIEPLNLTRSSSPSSPGSSSSPVYSIV